MLAYGLGVSAPSPVTNRTTLLLPRLSYAITIASGNPSYCLLHTRSRVRGLCLAVLCLCPFPELMGFLRNPAGSPFLVRRPRFFLQRQKTEDRRPLRCKTEERCAARSQFLISVENDLAHSRAVPGLEWLWGTKMTTDEEDYTTERSEIA